MTVPTRQSSKQSEPEGNVVHLPSLRCETGEKGARGQRNGGGREEVHGQSGAMGRAGLTAFWFGEYSYFGIFENNLYFV